MGKRGLVGMIILIVLGVLIVSGIGAGIYFYNYHVFEEVRACVGGWEDTMFPCEAREDCLLALNFSNDKLDGAPDLIKDNFNAILNSVVYCDGNCYVGQVRGIDYETGGLEGLESCEEGEEEFVVEIRGKDGIEILKWMKEVQEA